MKGKKKSFAEKIKKEGWMKIDCHPLAVWFGSTIVLPQEGRIHTEDGVFITPSALDGEGEDAAQDEPRLVPLTGRGEGVHQDALAFLHAQVPEGRVLQFRVL